MEVYIHGAATFYPAHPLRKVNCKCIQNHTHAQRERERERERERGKPMLVANCINKSTFSTYETQGHMTHRSRQCDRSVPVSQFIPLPERHKGDIIVSGHKRL
jgi:hypothetical protein